MLLYKCSNCKSKNLERISGIHKVKLAKVIDVPGFKCQECSQKFFAAKDILAVEKASESLKGIFKFTDLDLKTPNQHKENLKLECPKCGQSSDFVYIYYKYQDTTLVDFPMGRCTSCADFFFLLDISHNLITQQYNNNSNVNKSWKINKLGVIEIEINEE